MRIGLGLCFGLGLVACVSEPRTDPAPVRPPIVPILKPAPSPPAARAGLAWIDQPLSSGEWDYRRDDRGSVALFGTPNADATFLIRCVIATKRIYLSRAGALPVNSSGQMTIRATTGLKSYGIANNGDTPPYVSAFLTPTDPHLDAMAFSRGRILVSVKGAADLILPTRPEMARVIEDCRA